MLRPLVKTIFLTKAAFEVARERIEDAVDALSVKAGECKSSSNDCITESKDRFKEFAQEVSHQVWQRSDVLENQLTEHLRRQVADFSLSALGDATEINELRAEIATLRAEIAELKSSRIAV